MPDAPALPVPAPKRGPLRWILLGCGVLTGIFVLGMSSCAGIFYFVYKGAAPVAKVGSDYLSGAPEMTTAFGGSYSIHRNAMGWNVSVVNDGGHASFTYSIRREKANEIGEAVVWLVRSEGAWKAIGARLRPHAGEPVTVGKPPREHHGVDWD